MKSVRGVQRTILHQYTAARHHPGPCELQACTFCGADTELSGSSSTCSGSALASRARGFQSRWTRFWARRRGYACCGRHKDKLKAARGLWNDGKDIRRKVDHHRSEPSRFVIGGGVLSLLATKATTGKGCSLDRILRYHDERESHNMMGSLHIIQPLHFFSPRWPILAGGTTGRR